MRRDLLVICALAVVFAASGIFLADKSARATLAPDKLSLAITQSPIFADLDTSAGSYLGTTPTQAIADRSPALEAAHQRLIITNGSNTNDLCVFWVAAGASCGSAHNCDWTGTNDGAMVRANSAWDIVAAGDLRTCLVASASPTRYHVSRAEVP